MATVVLIRLIYMICEMYIDDCTVFGDTNIEFVSRLKLIFDNFRKHNLYLKASKCFFGYSEVEFAVPNKLFSCLLTVGNGKSSIDCIFVRDICNPFSQTTLPTNSSSE